MPFLSAYSVMLLPDFLHRWQWNTFLSVFRYSLGWLSLQKGHFARTSALPVFRSYMMPQASAACKIGIFIYIMSRRLSNVLRVLFLTAAPEHYRKGPVFLHL